MAPGSTTYTTSDPFVLGLGRVTFLGLGVPVWIALVLCGIGGIVLQRTRFGETVFATGGAESSALLMGLPVAASPAPPRARGARARPRRRATGRARLRPRPRR